MAQPKSKRLVTEAALETAQADKISATDVVAVTPLIAEDVEPVTVVTKVNGNAPDTSGNVTVTVAGGGGGFTWRDPVVATSAGLTVTAVAGQEIPIDARSGEVTVILPASPAKGDKVRISRIDDSHYDRYNAYAQDAASTPTFKQLIDRGSAIEYSFDGTAWRRMSRLFRFDHTAAPSWFSGEPNGAGAKVDPAIEVGGLWPRRARLKHRKGKMLAIFTAGTTYAATVGTVAAHTDPAHPSGSIEISNSSANGASVAVDIPTTDFTDKIVRLLANVPNTIRTSSLLTAVRVRLYSNAGASANFVSMDVCPQTYVAGGVGWAWMGGHISDFTTVGTGANITAINRIEVRMQAPSGATSASPIGLAWIEMLDNISPKAKLVFWFDDLTSRSWDAAAQMDKYGFPGVAMTYIGDSSNATGKRTRALQRLGWQIGTHSFSGQDHNDNPIETVRGSFMRSKFTHNALNLWGGDDFGWFGGLNPTEAIEHSIAQNFRSGRLYITGHGATGFRSETLPPIDPVRMLAFGDFTAQTLANLQLGVERAIKVKGVYNLVNHSAGSPGSGGVFDQFLAWLDAPEQRSRIDVVTIDDALAPFTTFNT